MGTPIMSAFLTADLVGSLTTAIAVNAALTLAAAGTVRLALPRVRTGQ
ncbi:hypothetical protein EV646_113195 [Kribbella antiqua]|uniref:Uncharacterized protein n=1 Tax=Kribbella antiqua TaxID=2512217 RepID=A0A4R2ID96_9ACTN|nr:hypothetical protein EV646_113195 [Kribbella antiqua]